MEEYENKRSIYPIVLEKIWLPESEGGPGIRRTKDINAVKTVN